jgi:hypothetical protein
MFDMKSEALSVRHRWCVNIFLPSALVGETGVHRRIVMTAVGEIAIFKAS